MASMSNFHNSAGHEEHNEEISALEYARLNGLARNHLGDPSPIAILNTLQEIVNDGLIDDSHLKQLKLPLGCNMHERPMVSKDAAQLLAWVMHPQSDKMTDDIVPSIIGTSNLKQVRLDLTLLRSDHESDIKKFANREAFEPRLKEVRLPLEVLDIENNEGLDFSSILWNLGAKTLEELKKERISATRESMQFMQSTIRPDWTDIDESELWRSLQKYNRVGVQNSSVMKKLWRDTDMINVQNVVFEAITPPLSLILQPVEPYEPSISDPAFHIPILSDPVSLTQFELSTIEGNVVEQDTPNPLRNALNAHCPASCTGSNEDDFIPMADAYCLLESMIPNSSSSIVEDQPTKRDIFKVEGPLTPPMLHPVPKSVHFSDFVEEMLLDTSSSSPLDPLCNNTHLEKIFGSAAKTITEQIEQETLLVADATGRVEVPVMDFSVPDAPWKILPNAKEPMSTFSIQKEIIKGATGEGLPKWPGQKNGQARLKWNPFPHDLADDALKEDYSHDDNRWHLFLDGPEDDQIIDTSTLTWKPPGLKILKEDEDDEIEPGNFQKRNPQDIVLLAKKRRMMFEVDGADLLGEESTKSKRRSPDISPYQRATSLEKRNTLKSKTLQSMACESQSERIEQEGSGLLMGDVFSAGNALDNFLELRGINKQKLGHTPNFTKDIKQDQIQIQTTRPEVLDQITTSSSEFRPVVDKLAPLPVPEPCIPTAPICLIVSSNLLKHRALVKYIESQLPGLKLIERDYTAHNTIEWLPNSITRSPVLSPLDSEADLIVSPSTGIVLTTLQKIKQKPLPGQKTRVPIRERLENISVRYDKLVVLVSKGSFSESCSGLDENDCHAFCEFVGFTSGLAATVLVHFVDGGERTLFKWLLNSIVQHAAIEGSLIEEETHWELFLRRAGMNAFAAQSISASMKASEDIGLPGSNKSDEYGLAAFVHMGKHKRTYRFGEMCGKRLLERVSACLDARWH